jgi:hypothetical protein
MTFSSIELETAVLEILKASDTAQRISTWESELRECMFTGEQLARGFRTEELPAVMVSTALDPTKSSAFTMGEIRYAIPLQVVIVTRSTRKEEARAELLGLMRSLEVPLNQARATSGLGDNTFVVDELLSSHVVVQDKPHCFGVGNITATVMKVVDL